MARSYTANEASRDNFIVVDGQTARKPSPMPDDIKYGFPDFGKVSSSYGMFDILKYETVASIQVGLRKMFPDMDSKEREDAFKAYDRWYSRAKKWERKLLELEEPERERARQEWRRKREEGLK